MAKAHWQARARFVETDVSNPEQHKSPDQRSVWRKVRGTEGDKFCPLFYFKKLP